MAGGGGGGGGARSGGLENLVNRKYGVGGGGFGTSTSNVLAGGGLGGLHHGGGGGNGNNNNEAATAAALSAPLSSDVIQAAKDIRYIAERASSNNQDDQVAGDWMYIGLVLDSFTFWVTGLVIVAGTAYFLMSAPNSFGSVDQMDLIDNWDANHCRIFFDGDYKLFSYTTADKVQAGGERERERERKRERGRGRERERVRGEGSWILVGFPFHSSQVCSSPFIFFLSFVAFFYFIFFCLSFFPLFLPLLQKCTVRIKGHHLQPFPHPHPSSRQVTIDTMRALCCAHFFSPNFADKSSKYSNETASAKEVDSMKVLCEGHAAMGKRRKKRDVGEEVREEEEEKDEEEETQQRIIPGVRGGGGGIKIPASPEAHQKRRDRLRDSTR